MKWLFKFSIALMVLALILSGCGKTSNSSGSSGGGSPGSTGGGGADEKVSGEITVYTALEDDQLKGYTDAFYKEHPEIKLNIVRDSTGVVVAKIIAEKDNPQADVVWGTGITELSAADDLGLLEPYAPKGVERVLPEFKDSKDVPTWVGIDVFESAIAVNTIELEKLNLPIPRSFEDLIKPEYRGLITMPNPSSSGTGFFSVSGFLNIYGEEGGWEYMDKLHENMAVYTHSGSKPAKMAATGEYPIGISFGYRVATERDKGAPIEMVFPSEGSGWDLESNALIKKPDIKPAAKVFLDWAISDAAMEEYGKNFAILSVPGINHPIPEGYPEDPASLLLPLDQNAISKIRHEILAEWDKRFSMKSEPK